jgi:ABC-type multidrug transport system fused ATPase/permease subunit
MPVFEPQILTLAIFILGLFLIIALSFVFSLSLRIKKLTRGSQGSFEDVIQDVQSTLTDYQSFKSNAQSLQSSLEAKVSEIKSCSECYNFKAFDGMGGGKNSFVTAFLDDYGNGVLLSTIDTRDRVNIFAKSITAWESERTLSEEESQVLTKLKK